MNRSLTFITLVISIIFCFTACQKEVLDPNGPTVTGDFRANVNGVQFLADKSTGASRVGGVLAIYGLNTSNQQIVLRVADSGVHVYSFDINSTSNFGAYQGDSSQAGYSTNQGNTSAQSGGTLSVTSIDTTHKTLSGTFSIKVYRQLDSSQKTITEGVFNNIPYQTTIVAGTATDSFRVKIDGVDFNPSAIVGVNLYGNISVSGSDQNGSKTVGITFPTTTTPGTYSLARSLTYIGQYNPNTSTFLQADSGNLIILENNPTTKRVRGSFDFHASPAFVGGSPQATLTTGYFSVVYQ